MKKFKCYSKGLVTMLAACILWAVSLTTNISAASAQPANRLIMVDGQFAGAVDFNRDTKVIEQGPYLNLLKNYPDGYQIKYPADMWVDVSMSPVRTTLANYTTLVEIYRQPLDVVPDAYINYGNRPITTGADKVQIIKNQQTTVNGHRVRWLWWQRPRLKNVPADKNIYASVDIVVSNREVYSLLFKSASLPVLQNLVPTMVKSFAVTAKQGHHTYARQYSNHRSFPLSAAANEVLNTYFKGDKQYWGIFEHSFPARKEPLANLEQQLDYNFKFVLVYTSFDSPLPKDILQRADAENKIVELTLQTTSAGRGSLTYAILNGEYDSWLKAYARAIKDFGKPVLFRLNNEMNGDWCSYSAYHSSKDTGLYIATWRYIYQLFREQGVDNALWVWNPHDVSFPNFKWNHYLTYYPGDDYVDIVGLTGYNTGTYYPGEKWRGFKQIYDPLYQEYSAVFPHKPFMITEFGSNSVGGDKVAWINDAFRYMKEYKQIKVMIWWNGIDWDGTKPARIYRIDQTPAVINAVKQGLQGYK